MKKIIFLSVITIAFLVHTPVTVAAKKANECPSYLNSTFKKLHASDSINLCELTQGKPVLLVNTASNCGYTPHFKKLEAIHKKYAEQGLVVIGFPSDDFFQEEDDEADTAKICYINYGVTFTMVSTSAVRGSDANPVFKYLGDKSTSPKWNFYKYLVSGDGKRVKSFSPRIEPDDHEFIAVLEELIATQ